MSDKSSDEAVDAIIKECMQKWLLECFKEEYDQDKIHKLTYYELIKCVNKYYEGGIKGFIKKTIDELNIRWKNEE